jgi:hypothetical protein
MGWKIARGARGLLFLLAGPVACGSSPTEPSWDGQVQVVGSVLDYRTDAAVGSARVTFGSMTATTNGSGGYTLTVPAGEHRVLVDDETLGIVNLKSRNYRGDFYVRLAGCVGRYGTVVDSRTRRPVSGATVSIGGGTATTDQNGWFRLDLGCPGEPCIGFNTTFLSISHSNYASGSFVAGRGVCFVQRVDYELVRR